ncbi:MAG: acetate kinase [Clostridia bacterium]
MKVLVVNAGSSSLKYQLIDTDMDTVIAKGLCERIGMDGSVLKYKPTGKEAQTMEAPMKDHKDAIRMVLDALVDPKIGVVKNMDEIDAVGHRVVHGGEKFNKATVIDDEFINTVKELSDLAPLHNPANLMGIEACRRIMPNTPMVGVFDTAFHQTMPPEAFMYGLPYEAYTDLKVRRYGFHGISHFYVSQRAINKLNIPAEDTKIITCHLGNGSSITAVKGGKSIDTSMGFTPLEGVPMGTRCGDMDPAIVTYLMEKLDLDIHGINTYMNKKSGVMGLSGVSSDFRDLDIAANKEKNARAKLALDAFAYRVKKYIGAYAAAMNGVDAIVFTAGVGENDRNVRELVLQGLEYLGVDVDFEYNQTCQRGAEVELSKKSSRVKVFVIPTDEEMVIANDTARLVSK